jgi:hypothetical protein
MFYWSVLVFALVLILVRNFYVYRRVKVARKKGLWPAKGIHANDDDVRRLINAGEIILAMRLYRQIHQSSLLDAKAGVARLADDRKGNTQ